MVIRCSVFHLKLILDLCFMYIFFSVKLRCILPFLFEKVMKNKICMCVNVYVSILIELLYAGKGRAEQIWLKIRIKVDYTMD